LTDYLHQYLRQMPSLPYPLKALLLLSTGIILLRIAGKRSLSEMTVAEAVMRIAIGTILIQPLGMKKEWEAIYGGILLIIGIVILAKMQIWIPKFRSMLVGVPSVLIKDGKMQLKEIKKARLSTDEVEVQLRLNNIGNIEDVELAIFESSGKLSTTLKPNKEPATKEDIQKIMDFLAEAFGATPEKGSDASTTPLFKEAYDEAKHEEFQPEKH
jgi:uncharacterized membrane protein YcaP (DUF421 family)